MRPNVLVVLSYHVGMEWEDAVLAGLRETLGERAELVLVQLDVKRFPLPGREAAMEANFASKFGMSHPAAVVAIDDYAYDFVLRRRAQLPAGVPVVFGGVNFLPGAPPAGVGGVVEAIDLAGTLELAGALFPQARRLVVVNDTTETGRSNDAVLAATLGAGGPFATTLRLGHGTFAETEAALASLDATRDVVLLLSWNLDSTGAARTYEQAVAAARAASPAPLFGPWSFYFGRGIVGGALLDGRVHGREVGEIAATALAGTPGRPLPLVGRCRTELLLDARELVRFGVPLANVPTRARVQFAEHNFWREHWRVVSLVGLVIGLQALTIGHLLLARRRERRAEQMLRTSEAQLRQSQRIEALGRLVGGVAHDFNNLLLVIRGSVELARQPGTTAAETGEYLHDIEQAAQRAAELTRQLLAFGRQQRLHVRPVDLAPLVAGMLKMVRRVLGETITVDLAGPPEGCWANVDPGQIEQVIMNLCVNARAALPEGGRSALTLGAARRTGNAGEGPGAGRPGLYRTIEVADNGVGMSPEILRRVFEPFFSTKPVGRGTGLGLSVVQGIVQQHGGVIEVRSVVGTGTTFQVHLPAIDAPAEPPAPCRLAPAPASAPEEGGGRVLLLAEDDSGVRRIAGGLLRSQGYEVLEATNGEEACTLAAAHQGAIAAAILDVVMPRMSGPEAARRLQQARPGLPILLCSGYTGLAHKEAAFAPDWQWLQKPYAVADLLACVRRMLAEAKPAGLAEDGELGSGSAAGPEIAG